MTSSDGHIVQPLWRNETQALEVAQAAAEHLDVRYCLDGGQIIPTQAAFRAL